MLKKKKSGSRRARKRLRHRGKLLSERKQSTRNTLESFLIVCEGEKTEPLYFQEFKVPKEVCKVVGVGANTISLVKKAIQIRDEKEEHSYDQVWCVFDRDSFPAKNFNGALSLAKKEGIKVAYSNEAFELWYLLHFDYHDAAISRDLYAEKLSQKLGFEYVKNNPNMFELLEEIQEDAIEHAQRLLSTYITHHPYSDNPCTTVHQLVIELNKNSRK